MAVTVEELREYIGASVSDDEFLGECLTAAVALVEAYTGGVDVPVAIEDLAYKQVASELFNRRNAPNGIAQFSTFDGSPIRVARDPMTSTYPLLNAWVVGGV